MKENLINEVLYELHPNPYCGVFMPKRVMKKLIKVLHKYQNDTREILTEHVDELYSAHWTMATADNKDAVYIKYVKQGETAHDRIKLFKVQQPERLDSVYIVNEHKDANQIAKRLIEKAPIKGES